mmetsp:Transcript_15176/g.47178  ORF Transcript_15176/g.47178 Transcript_15176/m.47178 type:complete len:223 (-) Transcript_15176:125-793(-)
MAMRRSGRPRSQVRKSPPLRIQRSACISSGRISLRVVHSTSSSSVTPDQSTKRNSSASSERIRRWSHSCAAMRSRQSSVARYVVGQPGRSLNAPSAVWIVRESVLTTTNSGASVLFARSSALSRADWRCPSSVKRASRYFGRRPRLSLFQFGSSRSPLLWKPSACRTKRSVFSSGDDASPGRSAGAVVATPRAASVVARRKLRRSSISRDMSDAVRIVAGGA